MTSPRSDPPWVAPEPVDIVWFTGSDAERFLNDLISQEIADLGPGGSRRSFLLSPQGKLDYLFWVVRADDRIGLIIEGGRGDELTTTLGRYRIRVDVEMTQEPAWLVMGEWSGFDVSWGQVARHVVVGERPDLPEGRIDDYERIRIAAGEPRWGVDVDGGTIPQESGLVPAAVDFDKGCFLGQELVARIESRGGNVPRHLRRLVFEGGHPEPGAVLERDGNEVGLITSTGDGVGLGMVKRGVAPGEKLQVGEIDATVEELTHNT